MVNPATVRVVADCPKSTLNLMVSLFDLNALHDYRTLSSLNVVFIKSLPLLKISWQGKHASPSPNRTAIVYLVAHVALIFFI